MASVLGFLFWNRAIRHMGVGSPQGKARPPSGGAAPPHTAYPFPLTKISASLDIRFIMDYNKAIP